jgi:hypothetical protein
VQRHLAELDERGLVDERDRVREAVQDVEPSLRLQQGDTGGPLADLDRGGVARLGPKTHGADRQAPLSRKSLRVPMPVT